MKRVLITGKNSYIGTSVENWLLKEPDKFSVDTLDVKNESWKEHDFSKYDVVFHVAGIVHQKEKPGMMELYFKINRDLPVILASKAKQAGVSQFIFMSTMAVYGENGKIGQDVVISKDTPVNPKTFYASSKLSAELELNKLSDNTFKVVILRTPIVYGENCLGNYAKMRKTASFIPIFPLIDNKRSMIHIDKLCEYVIKYIVDSVEGLYLPQDDNYLCTCLMFKDLAMRNGKTVYLSKTLGSIIVFFGKRISIFNKIFGNLVYEKVIINMLADCDLEKIKYSVLMSVYYKETPENLRESINSMLNQSIVPDEIVLVKDGQLTNSLDNVLNEYKGNQILKIVELDKNVGLGNALKIGLENCRNEIVARMDTDDFSESNRCEKQYIELSRHNVSVVGSSVSEFIDQKNNIVAFKNVFESHIEIVNQMKYRNAINHPTVMFKKSDVLAAGSYQDWYLNEDYYLWIRMILKGYKFMNLNESLVRMRTNNETYLRRGGWVYFITQKKLFDFMLKERFITFPEYLYNNSIRFVTRLMIPNNLRRILYKRILRKSNHLL